MSVDLGFLTEWWWQPLMDQVIIPLTEPIADALAEGAQTVVEEMEEFSDCNKDEQANAPEEKKIDDACAQKD